MFADLVGFTAWSSVREPAQVFILLEAVYSEFDELAKKRGVFKVHRTQRRLMGRCRRIRLTLSWSKTFRSKLSGIVMSLLPVCPYLARIMRW